MKIFSKDEWDDISRKNHAHFSGLHKSQRAGGIYMDGSVDVKNVILVYDDYRIACKDAADRQVPFLSIDGNRVLIASGGPLARVTELSCIHNMEIIEAIKTNIKWPDSSRSDHNAICLIVHVTSLSDLDALRAGGLNLYDRTTPSCGGFCSKQAVISASERLSVARGFMQPTRSPFIATTVIPYVYAVGIKESQKLLNRKCSLAIRRIDDEMSGVFLAISGVSPKLDRIAVFSRSGQSCDMLTKRDVSVLSSWSGVVETAFRGLDGQKREVYHAMTTLDQGASDIVFRLNV